MNYNNITFEIIEDFIGLVTINRPDKMNALNIETIQEIGKVFDEIYTNRDIKGVILTGAGEKAFVAGADISEFANFSASEGKELSAKGHDVFNKIENCPKPVIAAVNGFALGGGCELAMACHMRVASEHAKFGQPEVNLGILPGYGGTQRLPRLVGPGIALELILTADMVGAQDAQRIGLANHVVGKDNLMEKCISILKKIATKGPVAVQKTIECVGAYYDKNQNGFEKEIAEFGNCFDTKDLKEGTKAFVEKRKAEFIGA